MNSSILSPKNRDTTSVGDALIGELSVHGENECILTVCFKNILSRTKYTLILLHYDFFLMELLQYDGELKKLE